MNADEIFTLIALALGVFSTITLLILIVIMLDEDFRIGSFIEKHFPRVWGIIREINPNQGDRKSLKAVLQNEQEPNVFVYYKRYHFVGFYEDKTQVHVYDFESSAEDVFKTLEKLHGKLLSIVEVL